LPGVNTTGNQDTTGNASTATSASHALSANNTISSSFAATASYADNFTVAGEIVAQTLNVQQVTSSVVYSSGSNVFGNDVSNTQQFTGSLQVSGSTHYLLGNVGIGESNPSKKLEILQPSDSSYAINIKNTSGRYAYIGYSGIYQLDFGAAGSNDNVRYGVFSSGGGIASFYTNNTERMRIDSSGNVGIGTTSPQAPLHVIAATSDNDALIQEWSYTNGNQDVYSLMLKQTVTAAVVRYNFSMVNASTAYNDVLVLDRGNVGIGTTSIPGDHILQISNSTQSYARVALTNSQTGNASGDGLIFQMENLNSIIKNQENGYLVFGTNGRETDLFINSSGNVGIGTTSPSKKLEVNSGVTSDIVRFGNDSGYFVLGQTTNLSSLDLVTSNALRIRQGSSTSFYIKSDGNVGIGTTSPDEKLDVAGNIAATSASDPTFKVTSTDVNYQGRMRWNSAGNYLEFLTRYAGTYYTGSLVLDRGNVGIGVTPSTWGDAKAIQVGSTAAPYLALFQQTTSTSDGYLGWNARLTGYRTFAYITTGDAVSLYRLNAGNHVWFNAPSGTAGNAISFTQAMTLNASGNLSIGNTNDTYKLDVSGTGRFSENVTINGTIIGTDQTFGGAYRTFAFGGNSNGFNRIFATTDATDGIYINAATGQGLSVRVNGGGANVFSIASTGAATFSGQIIANAVNGAISVNGSGYTLNPSSMLIGLYTSTRGYIQVPNSGQFEIWTAGTSEIATFKNNGDSIFYGNVGIGTTSPGYKLDVDGGSSSTMLRVSTTNTGAGVAGLILANSTKIAFNDGVKIAHGGGYTNISDLSNNNIMTWDMSNSRVGIGTTSPAVKLQINDSSISSGGSAIHAYGFDGAANLYTTRGESPYNAALYLYNNPASGQGYGTGILFRAKSDVTFSQIQGGIYTTWTTAIDASRTSKMVFSTTNSGTVGEKLTILGNGNIGIGTTSPSAKLHVNGTTKVQNSGGTDLGFQTVTGIKTATGSGTGVDVAYIGHTHAIQISVVVIENTSNVSTALGSITTAYGSSSGGLNQQANLGNVTNIAISYVNSGGATDYVLRITPTYSGAAPSIHFTVTGMSHDTMYVL
jgi:hypothetical protein